MSSTVPQKEPILIAVVGITGVGKSTFINLISGSDLEVGTSLKPCTTEVGPGNSFNLGDREVILFDTPGFDDPKGDVVVLKEIANFFCLLHEKKQKIHGLIYLHRITDNRLGHSGEQTYNLITKMCGTRNFANIVVATTRWEKVKDKEDREQAKQSEAQLRSEKDFFQGLAAGGAAFMRHENTRVTAEAIVKQTMQNNPVVLQIQVEMVDRGLVLSHTDAGLALLKEITDTKKEADGKMKVFDKETAAAKARRDAIAEAKAREDRLKEQIVLEREQAKQKELEWNQELKELRAKVDTMLAKNSKSDRSTVSDVLVVLLAVFGMRAHRSTS